VVQTASLERAVDEQPKSEFLQRGQMIACLRVLP
jgi:hypothetical protein